MYIPVYGLADYIIEKRPFVIGGGLSDTAYLSLDLAYFLLNGSPVVICKGIVGRLNAELRHTMEHIGYFGESPVRHLAKRDRFLCICCSLG